MRIAEVKESLDRMRKIYDFTDEDTHIRINGGAGRNMVEVETIDNDTEVTIHMSSVPWIRMVE